MTIDVIPIVFPIQDNRWHLMMAAYRALPSIALLAAGIAGVMRS
jgi:hypothetical protein